MPVADAISTAESFVNTLFLVYLICIFLYILSSWIRLPYNVWVARAQRFLYDVVNPYLAIFRRLLPTLSLGGQPRVTGCRAMTTMPATSPMVARLSSVTRGANTSNRSEMAAKNSTAASSSVASV